MFLDEVRTSLISEANQSPNLLSDLAGLEEYVAESYDSRSFIELLQNADDAGATRFFVGREGDYLYVGNDGHCFSREDFESLCRSASSNKTRVSSIGYRGIGFKSVVTFAKKVYLVSGGLEAVFCRTRTKMEVPRAQRVPLVRIPHVPGKEDSAALENARSLLKEGYKTVFVFADLAGRAIETEFGAFDSTTLLFLRHIRQVALRTRVQTVVTLKREDKGSGVSIVQLCDATSTSKWRLQETGDIVLAFRLDKEEPAKLDGRTAVVHAFLPTLEKTGLGIKINGDFSTDPSRTRVVLDERTGSLVKQVAASILDSVESALSEGSMTGFVEALVPEMDPRLASFQRQSFERELLTAIVEMARGRFQKYRLRPKWFKSAEDFERQAAFSGLLFVSHRLESCPAFLTLLRAVACREATLEDMAGSFVDERMSVVGAADVVNHLCTLNDLGQLPRNVNVEDWQVWPVGGKVQTLAESKASGSSLDEGFLDLMREKSGSLTGLQRLATAIGGPKAAGLIPFPARSGTNKQPPSVPKMTEVAQISLRKWRNAEQQVCDLLNARGWRACDVGAQNLGYDIEASKAVEGTIYVEVKSIDYAGQPFILTSNEEAVAREKGVAYRIAIVQQTKDSVKIAFIADPASSLHLVRQCRQWVWFCEQYPYAPEQFGLHD